MRPDDRRGKIDGAGLSGSRQVAGSRSTPKVWVPEREQCVDGRSSLLARPVWPVFGRLSTLCVQIQTEWAGRVASIRIGTGRRVGSERIVKEKIPALVNRIVRAVATRASLAFAVGCTQRPRRRRKGKCE